MACLLRFGSLPPAVDPTHPTPAELRLQASWPSIRQYLIRIRDLRGLQRLLPPLLAGGKGEPSTRVGSHQSPSPCPSPRGEHCLLPHTPYAACWRSTAQTWSPTALVDAVPPRSGVLTSPTLHMRLQGFEQACGGSLSRRENRASSARPRWWPGFAMPWPLMSGAEPCTDSNMEGRCSGLGWRWEQSPYRP